MTIIYILLFIAAVVMIALVVKRWRNSKRQIVSTVDSAVDAMKDKYSIKQEKKKVDATKTMDSPHGLIQGTQIQLSPDVIAASAIPGSMFPELDPSQKVVAVGILSILDTKVYRAYLGDDSTFIQTVVDQDGNPVQVELYTKVVETTPDQDGWQFLLNDEDGAIGLSQYALRANDGSDVQYLRTTPPAKDGIVDRVPPIQTVERVADEAANKFVMGLQLMNYARKLEENDTELMVVQAYELENGQGAGCDAYVGITLPDENSFTVL